MSNILERLERGIYFRFALSCILFGLTLVDTNLRNCMKLFREEFIRSAEKVVDSLSCLNL